MKKRTAKKNLIQKCAAQGDVLFIRVADVPGDAKPAIKSTSHIVAHSETGHHHVARGEALMLHGHADPMICFLSSASDIEIVHERSFDTHATICLAGGVWKVQRQREAAPEGWRRVED